MLCRSMHKWHMDVELSRGADSAKIGCSCRQAGAACDHIVCVKFICCSVACVGLGCPAGPLQQDQAWWDDTPQPPTCLANVPAGETQFCMFASRICPPLSDYPKQQIVSVATPSGPKRALHPMSACTVLQSCLALVAASGLLHVQGCPGSWQTHAQFAVSSCSKPRGLLSLLQRSDCQLPGPALR